MTKKQRHNEKVKHTRRINKATKKNKRKVNAKRREGGTFKEPNDLMKAHLESLKRKHKRVKTKAEKTKLKLVWINGDLCKVVGNKAYIHTKGPPKVHLQLVVNNKRCSPYKGPKPTLIRTKDGNHYGYGKKTA